MEHDDDRPDVDGGIAVRYGAITTAGLGLPGLGVLLLSGVVAGVLVWPLFHFLGAGTPSDWGSPVDGCPNSLSGTDGTIN